MRIVIFILLVASCLPGFSQINFERLTTWEEASKRARLEKKLVFLHLEDEKCTRCNEVAAAAFASDAVKEKFALNFVSIRVNIESEQGKKLAEKFDVQKAPVSLFIDASGNVLNRYPGSSSAGFVYVEQADIALSRKDGKQLSDYKKQYDAGERSLQLLEGYIKKRKEASLPVEDLLDQYVGKLTVDSLSSYRVVKFIYGSGPTLDSRAYLMLQMASNRKLIDSLYKTITKAEAGAVNNAIITASFQKAVRKKDRELIYQVANFTRMSHGPQYENGSLGYFRNMVRFYHEIKDTALYIREASGFLDRTHMNLTADSLRRMDEREMKARMAQFSGKGSNAQQMPGFAPPSQFYHMDLNEHAWHVYEMSNKVADLERALKWSYQSQEFFNSLYRNTAHPMRLGNPAYIDTYAQILYKLGRKEEAIEWQTRAVQAQKVSGTPERTFEETLEKMKAGEALR